jgi:hypothetical protein
MLNAFVLILMIAIAASGLSAGVALIVTSAVHMREARARGPIAHQKPPGAA